jgi:branched-subunit amino acid aminotransferase/4-amino-4-deoxychorismate lyase
LDPSGFIAEGTGSNFFIVTQDNKIVTPKPINCLRGISREFVISIVKNDYLVFIEDDITLYDIVTAKEAFFTCTPFSIVPCTYINGMPIGDGGLGQFTEALTDEWIKRVGCDFITQAIRWDE